MEISAYEACCSRLAHDAGALRALNTLYERGSLEHLEPAGYEALSPELVHWLLRAESHAGSEIVYRTEEDKVRGIPLGSFFDYPERYISKMPNGAFISAETAQGGSVALYLADCTREAVLSLLEQSQDALPLTTDRPLRERIESRLKADGHLSCLSAEGLARLDAKMIKYLEYAVNVRPGSEVIYVMPDGEVRADPLEQVMHQPERYLEVPRPVFLAIDISDQSVIFDTHDLSPGNLWRLQKKARQVLDARESQP